MNDSLTSNSGRELLSDEQMDGLLRNFFQQEVPVALDRPFHRPVASLETTSVRIMAQPEVSKRTSRNGRLIVGSALSVLAMTLFIALTTQDRRPVGTGISNSEPAKSAASGDELMLVSPHADSRKLNHTVGEDGVTQQELDIEVSPRK